MIRKLTNLSLFSIVVLLAVESADAQQPLRSGLLNGAANQPRRAAVRGFRAVDRDAGLLQTIVRPDGAQTGWYPYVIAREQDRERLRSTPIELRPYRPLHFYGNAVRRSIHR